MTLDVIAQAAGIVFAGTAGLAALALAADRFLPERFIRERHDIAVAAFFVAPLVFVLTFLPGEPAVAPEATAALVETDWNAAPATPLAMTATASGGIAPTPARDTLPIIPALLSLWAAGSLLMALRLVRDMRALTALTRRAASIIPPAALRLSRKIDLRRSGEISSPMLAGYLRPVVLVPSDFEFNAGAGPVLEHEIAHAERRDNWVAFALRLITTAFWWNAPLYALQPMILGAREKLCDGRAAELTGAPHDLAHALLDAAAKSVRQPALSLAAAGKGPALAERIRLLSTGNAAGARRPTATLAVMLPVFAAIACVATPNLGEAQQFEGEDLIERMARHDADDADLAIYRAAYRGRTDEVRALVDAGFDPNAISSGDGTALMAAVRGGHRDTLEALLELGADPNIAVRGDGTPLTSAARLGDLSSARILLARGADPDLGIEGDGNPLISASRSGRMDMVRLLLDAGADANSAWPKDGNPLIGAALGGHRDVVEVLIAAGADPNGYVYRDETPLINAAQQGHIDVAEALVAAGADVSLTVETPHHDPGGGYRSPISEAERRGHADMVRWLEARGAEHLPPSDD